MEYPHSTGYGGGGRSLSKSSSDASDLNHSSSSNSLSNSHSNSNSRSHHQNNQSQQQQRQREDPMQSWWESVSKARTRIHTLVSLLPPEHSEALSSLADSERPGRSLLDSEAAYSAVGSALTGAGDDPLCQWLYDTFQMTSDSSTDDLRLVVLSFVPLLAGLYLTRIHSVSTTTPSQGSPSLAGFEAVLLALYSSETKSRGGKPLLVAVPTPSYLAHHPSLYHTPPPPPPPSRSYPSPSPPTSMASIGIGVMSPPLEPQVGIKSTKRALIVGVAFHSYYSHISLMPCWSKIDLCRFAASWAGHLCPCAVSLDTPSPSAHTTLQPDDDDDDAVTDSLLVDNGVPQLNGGEILVSQALSSLTLSDTSHQHGESELVRIPLPWELLQPLIRILGHCLLGPSPLVSDDIKDAASVAVRRLYARASHDLAPQPLLATRSLVQLDNRARAAAKAAALATASSRATTPKTPTKPEMLLVSK